MMLIRVLSGRGSRGVTAPRVHQSKRGKGCVGDDENDHRHHVCDGGDNADDDHHQGKISLNAMMMLLTGPDMIYVRNLTQPDFQATSFTPQKCIICDIFLTN